MRRSRTFGRAARPFSADSVGSGAAVGCCYTPHFGALTRTQVAHFGMESHTEVQHLASVFLSCSSPRIGTKSLHLVECLQTVLVPPPDPLQEQKHKSAKALAALAGSTP